MKKFIRGFIVWIVYIGMFFCFLYYKAILEFNLLTMLGILCFLIFSFFVMPVIMLAAVYADEELADENKLTERMEKQIDNNILDVTFLFVIPLIVAGFFFMATESQRTIVLSHLKDCKEYSLCPGGSVENTPARAPLVFYFSNNQLAKAIERHNKVYDDRKAAEIREKGGNQEVEAKEYENDKELANYLNNALSSK